MTVIHTHSPYTIDVPGQEHLPGRGQLRGQSQDRPRRRSRVPDLGDFCIVVAALSALTGMGLGMAMGIRQDFTLAPAHAHLNLLGWVTMALYGLYHRSTGRTGGWLGWLQVLAGVVGAATMSGGLALYLQSGDARFTPLVVAGSLMALAGMVLFVVILVADMSGSAARRAGGA